MMHPSRSRIQISLLLSASLVVLSACSGQKTSENKDASGNQTPAVTNTPVDSAKTAVTVTDKGCEPGEISVNAGKNTFVITNKSSAPLEWEILQGVKVIEERENIAPGFVQEIKTTLNAGNYDLVCGKKTGPKGKLVVTAGAAGTQASAPVDQGKLTGAIAEYKVYVQKEVDQLVTKTKGLTDAVTAGDLDKAQKLYAPTRVHWERAEPIAELFSDLDKSMDSRADDFPKKEADPEFTGYHRLEKALFQDKTTDGMKPITDKLNKDALELQKRITGLTIEPKNMVGGAAELIEEVAKTKISGEEDRYSHTDLWDFSANLEGSQKIVTLLQPLIEAKDPGLNKQITEGFNNITQTLNKYKTPDGGFEAYEKLSESDRQNLKTQITAQAEALSKLRGTLGVE